MGKKFQTELLCHINKLALSFSAHKRVNNCFHVYTPIAFLNNYNKQKCQKLIFAINSRSYKIFKIIPNNTRRIRFYFILPRKVRETSGYLEPVLSYVAFRIIHAMWLIRFNFPTDS